MTTLANNKTEALLSHLHFYSGFRLEAIPLKERTDLVQHARQIILPKKSVLYNQGEMPKGVYVITKGKIKFIQLNYDGSVQILFIYSVGEMFGHRTIISNDKFPVSAVGLEDCELLYIEKDHFLKVLNESSNLAGLLLQSISHEANVLVNRISLFAQKSIKERLAYFLLLLNQKFRIPGQTTSESEIKVNRSDLASYIGTSLENLVRTLKDFREKDYVRTNGKCIYINDFEALYSLTGFNVNEMAGS